MMNKHKVQHLWGKLEQKITNITSEGETGFNTGMRAADFEKKRHKNEN